MGIFTLVVWVVPWVETAMAVLPGNDGGIVGTSNVGVICWLVFCWSEDSEFILLVSKMII